MVFETARFFSKHPLDNFRYIFNMLHHMYVYRGIEDIFWPVQSRGCPTNIMERSEGQQML